MLRWPRTPGDIKDNYYFDNAATTWPKPEPVYTFVDSFFRRHGVNPGCASHQLAVEAETMVAETRRMLAQFFGFGGNVNRVVFSLNATGSLNTAIFGLVEPVGHMVMTRLEHNSVIRSPIHLERDAGVGVTRVAHMCCGYPDVLDVADYPKAPKNCYFKMAEAIDASSIKVLSVEDAIGQMISAYLIC